MRACLVVLSLLIALAGASFAVAGEPPVPIEGKLLVSGYEDVGCGWTGDTFAYLMVGSSDTIVSTLPFADGDISPLGDQVVYEALDAWPFTSSEIWKANLDGSGVVNLTESAGLTGFACMPQWSPDGKMIAFKQSEPAPGQLPCEPGFHVWVMNADGSDAHRVTPEGSDPTWNPRWLPNGYQIITRNAVNWCLILIDADGTDCHPAPHGYGLSPDGLKEARVASSEGVVDGQHGWWVWLNVDTPEGPLAFAEQFIGDDDAMQHLENQGADFDWYGDLMAWVPPSAMDWSPKGDRIAFLSAFPFDPVGPNFKKQIEVWVADLNTGDLTKVTSDTKAEFGLSWNGPNTAPDHPEVTVYGTTVTFSSVTGDGLTTIIRDDDPPAMPTGYQFCGSYYDINTTAPHSGPITITMTYKDEEVPGGLVNEPALRLVHYENEAWVDITTSLDMVNNTITGECTSLSPFGIAFGPKFRGFLPPVNNDNTSIFKLKSTVPLKFQLQNPDGSYVSNATARLRIANISGNVTGSFDEAVSTNNPDGGNLFRYDASANQYIFNLGTKGLSTGTWALQVVVNDLVAKQVRISLK